jgi:LPS sulfotransferase NodH
MRRFVVLTTPRTGSTHLAALLDSHPSIRCYPALFAKVVDVRKWVSGIGDEYADPEFRFRQALRFLDTTEALTIDAAAVGWKLMISQDWRYELLSRLVAERSYQVIFLYRENLLAKFSSQMLAQKTGQGWAEQGHRIIRETLHFEPEEFSGYIERVTRQYDRARKAMKRLGCRFLEVEYRDLADDRTHKRLTEFLGFPYCELTSPNLKRNKSRVTERFDNPDEVRRFLELRNLSMWAEEH